MLRKATIVALTLAATAGAGLPLMPAGAVDGGSISGVAYMDMNRNGVQDPGEAALTGHAVYLHDSTGAQLATAGTDAAGRYSFGSLPQGSYTVQYRRADWLALRRDFVPSTTGSIRPRQTVEVSGGVAVADFGWRPIVRSSSSAAPVSTWTAPDGLTVKTYNDAVTGQEVDQLLRTGGLLGSEVRTVTIRLDITSSSFAATSVMGSRGSYRNFTATINLSWAAFLDDAEGLLFHEYGHAWAGYYDHIVQQDGSLSGFLSRRGLLGDGRLDTTHAWSRGEIVAEDYRQLFGSPAARAGTQENTDIPAAAAVSGLADYLSEDFRGTTASPAPSPSPVSSPTPTPTPTVASPSPSPSPSKGKGGGGRK